MPKTPLERMLEACPGLTLEDCIAHLDRLEVERDERPLILGQFKKYSKEELEKKGKDVNAW